MNSALLLDDETLARVRGSAGPMRVGRVNRLLGIHVDVVGLDVAIGDAVIIDGPEGEVWCEVVAVHDSSATCMPFGSLRGVRMGARAKAAGGAHRRAAACRRAATRACRRRAAAPKAGPAACRARPRHRRISRIDLRAHQRSQALSR